MRIRELNLIRYGKFTDRQIRLPEAACDIHLVVGPNEAGKSTLRKAIADWLYGIPARTPLDFLHPKPDLRIGGVLQRGSEQLAFDRIKANSKTLRDPQDDRVIADAALADWLAGLDLQAFERMQALDHDTLVRGSADMLNASGQLGQLLFQSAAGLQHLGQLVQDLQQEADTLWAPRKSSNRVFYQAQDAFKAATQVLKEHTLRSSDWKKQQGELQQTQQQLQQARERMQQLEQQIQRLRRIRQAAPALQLLDEQQQALDALLAQGVAPDLPGDAASTLQQAQQDQALLDAEQQRLQHSCAELERQLAGIVLPQALLQAAEQIEALQDNSKRYRDHARDLPLRRQEYRQQEQRLQELASDLGWSGLSTEAIAQSLPGMPVRLRLQQLLKRASGIANALTVANKACSQLQQRQQQAHQELDALTLQPVSAELHAAMQQALALGDAVTRQQQLSLRLQQLQQQIDNALQALPHAPASPQALRSMLPPTQVRIEQLQQQQRDDAREQRQLEQTLLGLQQEVDSRHLILEQLVRTHQPVSHGQVQEARDARDALWQQLLQTPSQLLSQADAYAESVRTADTLADTRMATAQHEADRLSLQLQQEKQQQLIRQRQQELQALAQRQVQLQQDWQALCQAAGMPALTLDQASAWLQQREQILKLLTDLEEQELQAQVLQQSLDSSRMQLQQALGGEAQGLSLPACLQQAQQRSAAWERSQGERQRLQRELQQLAVSHQAAVLEQQQARTAWEDWQQQWQTACTDAGYRESIPDQDQMERYLDISMDMQNRLQTMQQLASERIGTMQADLDALAQQAQALQPLAPELSGLAADGMARELFQRLQQAREQQAAQQRLQAQCAEQHRQLEQVRVRQSQLQARLQPLYAAAGVSDMTLLAQVVSRFTAQQAQRQRCERDREELLRHAGGLSLDQLRAEVAAQELDSLPLHLQQAQDDYENVRGQLSELGRQAGTLEAGLQSHAGQQDAAVAEARRQEAITDMAEAMRGWLQLELAGQLLQWATGQYRERHQGPMLQRASAMFRTLTLGAFERLIVELDKNKSELRGVRANGQQVEVSGLSEGTRDQLYLALRLAALELQHGPSARVLPLIADDVFINFDDARTAAGLQVLGELSRQRQVLFLTHHAHLVPLAQQVLGPQLNVIEL